jgi:DNA-binding response OmpR family regulator
MESPFNPSSFEARVEASLRRIESALAKLVK